MNIILKMILVLATTSAMARESQKNQFHPYLGRKVETFMGPTAVQHQYADNREMKYVPQDKFSCEPVFALIDKNSFDKTVDLECVVFPYVYDPKQKTELLRLEELRRSECFHLSIATCVLNDKKVWRIESESVFDQVQCGILVASKKNKIEAARQCQIQTSASYKSEQKKIKEALDQKKQAEEQTKINSENSFSNLLVTRSIYDAGYETQGRYTLGYGFSFNKIKSNDGIGSLYPFLQVAATSKSIESYSLGVRIWAIYMLAINYHLAYEKVEKGRDRIGIEAGLGALAFTPYVGLAADFRDELNFRIGFRIILNSVLLKNIN